VSTVATQYAKSGDVHIAYQIVGDGPIDPVVAPGFVSHVECCREEPSYARFLRRLASFTRLILFDNRGTGLSDRLTGMATLEHRMDDVRAVMDAAQSDRAAILGISEAGALSAVRRGSSGGWTLPGCSHSRREIRGVAWVGSPVVPR
jgi:pimeloyl-ACP methyl ester carboxylesterase